MRKKSTRFLNVTTLWHTTVVSLLFVGGPSAILGGIITVVVNAIQGETLGALSHISQKVLERVLPTTAHFYASPSITGVVFGFCVQTSVLKPIPRFIGSAVGVAMAFGSSISLEIFAAITAAARGISRTHCVSFKLYRFTTGAFANTPSPAAARELFDDSEAAVNLT